MVESPIQLAIVVGCVLAGVVGFVLAGLAWRHRKLATVRPFGLLGLAMGGWGCFSAAVLLTDAHELAPLFRQGRLLTVGVVPPLWFWFASTYTGAGVLRDRRLLAATWLVPVALVVVGPFSQLVDGRLSAVRTAGPAAPGTAFDPLFWGFIIYAATLVVAGLLLFGWFLLRSRHVYRSQAAFVATGSALPAIGATIGLLGLAGHSAVELTPPLFAFGSAFFLFAWARYDFMAVTPVASPPIVEGLPAPILILDEAGTIVDHNAAARGVLGTGSLVGTPAASIHPELTEPSPASPLRLGASERLFDVERAPLGGRHVLASAHVVVLRDVTVRQRRLDRIDALQDLSQQCIEATTQTAIGDAAVEFLDAELGADVAVVYAANGGRYRPIATTGNAEALGLVVERVGPTHPLYDYATTEEPQRLDPAVVASDTDDPPPIIGVPLGAVGLLCLGLDQQSLAEEDEQSVRILRGTLTAALSRVEREQELGASQREVDRRTEQINFFTGVLQHNLRNGMQVIGARADYLREHTDEAGQSQLETVARWADDLLDLADQIGRITDVVTASPAERRQPMDIAPLLSDRLDAFEQTTDVFLTWSVPDRVPVYASALVETIIDSLLDNAVEHNDSAKPMLDVTVETSDEYVQIRIADDGPGIDDDLKESVFERAVATSQTASGFGLYFVSVMMDFYGGDVWLEDLTDPLGARSNDVAFEYQGTPHDAADEHGRPANTTLDPEGTVAVLQFQRADVT